MQHLRSAEREQLGRQSTRPLTGLPDFPKIGRRVARLGLPTLFVMEGGYAVDEIGINAVGVLTGFEPPEKTLKKRVAGHLNSDSARAD